MVRRILSIALYCRQALFRAPAAVTCASQAGSKRVGANVAVLIAHEKRTPGWYGDDFVFDIYIVDVDADKTYHLAGDELDYQRTIDRAFDRPLRQ